jgi:hypothetical protein
MAKATDDTSTQQIFLADAKALVMRSCYGSSMLAERLIRDGLEAGKVRWTCERMDWFWFVLTPEGEDLPGSGPSFWHEPVYVDWTENWARPLGYFSRAAYNVKVARADVLALLPPSESTDNENEATTAAGWITAEVKRMKAANKIPESIRITDFAKQLELRMRKVAATNDFIRPIGWRSIKNRLRGWSLWPVSSIR